MTKQLIEDLNNKKVDIIDALQYQKYLSGDINPYN